MGIHPPRHRADEPALTLQIPLEPSRAQPLSFSQDEPPREKSPELDEKALTTQWRREDKSRTMLEREGYKVIRIGCRSESVFHLIASSLERTRYIHVSCGGQVPTKEIRKFPVPPSTSREIWKWTHLIRKPEIVVV